MIVYVLFVAAVAACTALIWLWRRRYGPAAAEKAAADDVLGKLYGRYYAEVRALAQTRMLEAPCDDEWLATVKAQASAAANEPSGRAAHHSSRYAFPSRWARRLTGGTAALAVLAGLATVFHIVFAQLASKVMVVPLASLVVSIGTLAWTTYVDQKKRIAEPSAEVVARAVRVNLRDQGQAAAPGHIVEVVVTEICADQECAEG
jgi:hypothetical protein